MNATQLERLGEHLPKLLAFNGRDRREGPCMDRSRPQSCRVRLERLLSPYFRARLARPEMAGQRLPPCSPRCPQSRRCGRSASSGR